MNTALILLAAFAVVLAVLIPSKMRFLAPYLCLGSFALGSLAIGWILWAPRGYMLWSDNPTYQTILHPWILGLIAIVLLVVAVSIAVGLLIRCLIRRKQEAEQVGAGDAEEAV